MAKSTLIFDCEVFQDYFLLMFLNTQTDAVTSFEMFEGQPLDATGIKAILANHPTVGFNSINFDLPVLYAAMTKQSCAAAKEACDMIIQSGFKPWHVEAKMGFKISQKLDHIDIFDVAPGKASLKAYGARLHSKAIQDLPIDPSSSITPAQREELKHYCANDLRLTKELFEHLAPQIALRVEMGKAYGMDLRSKGDAAIAEAVIKHEVEKERKDKIPKPVVKTYAFKYKKPEFVSFCTPLLKEVLETVLAADFQVMATGKVMLPKKITELKIAMGSSVYRMGIGGLHSQEESVAHKGDNNYIIQDVDVNSYYPSIILQAGLYPPAMGKAFLSVYRRVYIQRLEAKKAGRKAEADTKKIVLNSSYGKLSNQYSSLYAPELSIQVVITGQLSLLMLIEQLELCGISVISANTDGVVLRYAKADQWVVDCVTSEWEKKTGFVLESVQYRALYNANVNNYIALKSPTGVKLKGAYAPSGLQKNPTAEICSEAVVAFLDKGTIISQTIQNSKDIRKFLIVRQVKGGAVKDGVYLGKVVRFYHGRLAFGCIQYKINGYKVAGSDGGEPCMTLPDEFPCDVDLDWYVAKAKEMLKEIGA